VVTVEMKLIVVFAFLLAACFASSAPYVDIWNAIFIPNTDGRVGFVPHELPCAHQIVANVSFFDVHRGFVTFSFGLVLSSHGTYFLLRSYDIMSHECQLLCRTDLDLTYDQVLFRAVFENDLNPPEIRRCTDHWIPDEEEDAHIQDSFLHFFRIKQAFEKKSRGVFKGKKCTVYSSQQDSVRLFADDNNYVIGYETVFQDEPDLNVTASFEYKFDAPLSLFALDDSIPGCTLEAYYPPTKALCGK